MPQGIHSFAKDKIMDTKTLYDWADEAGLDFTTEDPHDAIGVWQDKLCLDTDFLEDNWLDALAEVIWPPLPIEGREDTEKERRERMMMHTQNMCQNLMSLNSSPRSRLDMVTSCFATSLSFSAMQVGEQIGLALKKFCDDYVERYAEEWWADVCGYHYDMEQARKEDYYESRRDD